MLRITRDDIQRIGDESRLMHFLQEKLNLPIPKGATLAQIALPLPLPFLGLDDAIAEQIIDCQDFSGLPKDSLGERRPFLIRFRSERDYSEILRVIAESLHQKSSAPENIFFICADENFQPFAFAYFSDSVGGDWQAAELTVFSWTQGNTYINAGPEHEFPSGFFPDKFREEPDDGFANHRVQSTASDRLLAKLENIGVPLGRFNKIACGLKTGGCDGAFAIDELKRRQLIDEHAGSSELIKPLVRTPLRNRWKPDFSHLIWIPSSRNKQWPWSGTNDEAKAEQIFESTYPAISKHLQRYRNRLKTRSGMGEFYWEFPASRLYSMPKRFKIIYPIRSWPRRMCYDTSDALTLVSSFFIRTADLSLLAILNSTLFGWYAQNRCEKIGERGILIFRKKTVMNVPIAERTAAQKAELSQPVQQILDAPEDPEVPALEQEIDTLVYELYRLTDAEIALIEEESNP